MLVAIILTMAGLLGLVVGSFLNVVIYRVPAKVSLNRPSQCPNCDSPVKPWQNIPVVSWIALRAKCANCGERISIRYPLVELGTAIAFVLVVGSFLDVSTLNGVGLSAQLVVVVAFLYFVSISIALTLIDLDTRRLPNAIVLPSYVVASVLFTLACLLGAEWSALLRAVIGGTALFAFYFLLRVIRPGGMGGGDVKLAGVVGIYLGWLGWGPLVVGAFAAFVLGGIFGAVLLVTRRASRKSAIPFGPWMIAGAWAGIAFGEAITNWYLGLLAST